MLVDLTQEELDRVIVARNRAASPSIEEYRRQYYLANRSRLLAKSLARHAANRSKLNKDRRIHADKPYSKERVARKMATEARNKAKVVEIAYQVDAKLAHELITRKVNIAAMRERNAATIEAARQLKLKQMEKYCEHY